MLNRIFGYIVDKIKMIYNIVINITKYDNCQVVDKDNIDYKTDLNMIREARLRKINSTNPKRITRRSSTNTLNSNDRKYELMIKDWDN